MNLFKSLCVIIAFVLVASIRADAQEGPPKYEAGIGVGTLISDISADGKIRYIARPFIRYAFINRVYGELGAGYGQIAGDLFTTQMIPIDFRFLLIPVQRNGGNLYIYAGLGLLYYDVTKVPTFANAPANGSVGFAPVGIGMQIPISERLKLDINAGYNIGFSDNLNAVNFGGRDSYFSILTSIGYRREE